MSLLPGPRCRLEAPFVDERGLILNLVSLPVGNVSIIRSKYGAIRSNHYHKEDWHYLYMLSGQMLYFEREVGDRVLHDPIRVSAGQLIWTAANIEHAVLFLDDSEVLSMARDAQTHEEHEADVVRVSMLDRETADKWLKSDWTRL
jgi:quercetin dioxygenase-like cupin family protein